MDQKRLEAKLFIEGSVGNTRTTNRAKGDDQKGKSRGYFGKMNGVSGRRESRQIITIGVVNGWLSALKWERFWGVKAEGSHSPEALASVTTALCIFV